MIVLDRDIEVNTEVPVTVSLESVSDKNDPTEICYAWYPTKGFRVTLLYRPDVLYDVAWFTNWTGPATDFPSRAQFILMPTGVTAYTDEWMMPGNGVILYWFSTAEHAAPGSAASTDLAPPNSGPPNKALEPSART